MESTGQCTRVQTPHRRKKQGRKLNHRSFRLQGTSNHSMCHLNARTLHQELPTVTARRSLEQRAVSESESRTVPHDPFRLWCTGRTAGRGIADNHIEGRDNGALSAVSVDYAYLDLKTTASIFVVRDVKHRIYQIP